MAWDYYPDDKTVKGSGFHVIELVVPTQNMKTTEYRVRNICCGRERIATHYFIRARAKLTNAAKCRQCSREIALARLTAWQAKNFKQQPKKAGPKKTKPKKGKGLEPEPYRWVAPAWPVPELSREPFEGLHGEHT